jgi:SAM-dependent methyltransferase
VTQVTTREWPAADLESVSRCPACGGDRRAVLYDGLADRVFFCAGGGWSLHRCLDCSTAFLDPRPDRRTIGRAYTSYYTHPEVASNREPSSTDVRSAARNGYLNARYGYDFVPSSRLGRVLARLFPKTRSYADRSVRNLRRPGSGGRLLDVGCGHGAFLAEMRRAGWDVYGIEPDSAAARMARANGVPVANEPFEEASLAPESFDAITMNHVIEHFHDPVEALRISHRLLKPNGILWIATPNLASHGHALFGPDWIGLDPPRHLVLFTRSALISALARAGMKVDGFASDYSAQMFFPWSATIAAGEDPTDERAVRRHGNRLSVWKADLVARFDQGRAESIVLSARAERGR